MARAARFLILFIALQHIGFLILEMFLWTSPIGLKTFKMTLDVAESSATLAANQGLYNGFLAAGLIWSAFANNNALPLQRFFLACVLIAGVFGGLTAKMSILFIQGMPALIALVLVTLAHQRSMQGDQAGSDVATA